MNMLTSSSYFVDYIDSVLLDERTALTVDVIYEFLKMFFPKVRSSVHLHTKHSTMKQFFNGYSF